MEKATRQQTKAHNTRLVLKTIYAQGETSRADVARITHLTRTTVSDIAEELIRAGLIAETGVGFSAGGKPPILLSLNANARHFICLDLSGPDLEGAVMNLRGEILHRECAPAAGRSGKDLLEPLFGLLAALIPAAGAPVLGIGIGVPGLTDVDKGVVRRSIALDWTDLPLKELLAERFPYPTTLLNDSHAAALAEFTFGELRGTPNLIVVRIGRGIGAGILLSGRIHYGDGFGAGEIGHLTVVEGGRQCCCGNYGCLETVASPRAVIERMQELSEYDWISFSGAENGGADDGEIDWDFVRRAFEAGDETVVELVKEAGRYLGISIANLVSILNLHRIVISGSYVGFGRMFLEAINAEVQRRALFTMAAETQIVNSVLDPDNVLLGVCARMLTEVLGLP